MPTSLTAFAMPEPQTITMPDGSIATIRPLSLHIEQAVDKAFPQPRIPMIKDPNKGSNAPMIEDSKDPAYSQAITEIYYTRRLACVIVAIDLEIDGSRFGDCKDPGQWLQDAVKAMIPRVTPGWFKYARELLDSLTLPNAISEAGSKNSSTPQTTAGD